MSLPRQQFFFLTIIVIVMLIVPVRTAVSAVITPFTPRFSANDTGDIVFVANAIVQADPTDPNAANAQNGGGDKDDR